jgi:peptidoglycan/xylan/chitin deacetylase (PgdA/CDA1 family)
MARVLKLAVFATCRAIGLFALARRLTRDRLRILAYHGFADGDELRFQPKLFISGRTFAKRMELLRRRGFRIASLANAVQTLRQGRMDHDTVVITIDDGYASTASIAAPILARHGFPSTVYVTTYHVGKQTPVFDLVVGYMLWMTSRPQIELRWPEASADAIRLTLGSARERDHATDMLIRMGRAARDESGRVTLCRQLGEACGVDYDGIVTRGAFRLMNRAELVQASALGMSIGLHTHRHRFPPDEPEVCRSELAENTRALQNLGIKPILHFCYPSGEYAPHQWALLEAEGIESSTTCDTGLVCRGDALHGLKRFIDGEMVSEVEFDAEVCGFAELLRMALRVERGLGAR